MKKNILFITVILISVLSQLEAQVSKIVNVTSPGTLCSTLTSSEKAAVTDLTITGTVDARDFKTMRDSMPVLNSIDLSTIQIAAYTGYEGTYIDNSTQYPPDYQANELPINAFCNVWDANTTLTNIKLPITITSIGIAAFRNCGTLTSINIPASVTSIGNAAFYKCIGLSSITIPSSVISIGNYTFFDCTNLTSVEIPSSINYIGSFAFMGCSGLINVEGENLIYSSIDGVLFNKTKTELIQFPTSKIGSYIVPKSVTSIESYAFYNCSKLTSLTIPSSVNSIGFRAFNGYFDVDIANSVYSSAEGVLFDKTQKVLYNCPNSKAGIYVIPASVDTIYCYAFSDCSDITSVKIHSSVTSICANSFVGFKGLITVDEANSTYSSIDGVLFNKNQTALYNCPTSKTGNYDIPSSVVTIWNNAFFNCNNLTSVTIPDKVTSIGSYAFQNCTDLTSVIIPKKVTSIEAGTFYNCNRLTSVTIPTTVTRIKTGAFYNCSRLTSVTISAKLTTIEDDAFRNCTGLTSIYAKASIPAYLGSLSSVFYNVNKTTCTLYVPIGSRSTYQTTAQWSDFCNIVEKDFSVSKTVHLNVAGTLNSLLTTTEMNTISDLTITGFIDASDFKTMRDSITVLSFIYLSAAVVVAYNGTKGTSPVYKSYPANELPQDAFNNSTYKGKVTLTNIKLPLGITSIGYSAFQSCSYLTSINIPGSVTSIKDYAFSYCHNLTSINISGLVTSIGYNAFYNSGSLSSVTIPASVTSIGETAFGAFDGLINVEETNPNYSSADGLLFNKEKTVLIQCPSSKKGSYTIPASVTSIVDWAFYACSNLTSVTIPTSVTSIGSYVFYSCSGLTSIYANAPTPIDLSLVYSVFSNVNNFTCTLYVPVGAKSVYQAAKQWKEFSNIVEKATYVTDQQANEPIIYGQNGALYIKNAIANSIVKVYDTNGKIRFSGEILNSTFSVVLDRGLAYLVQINAKSYKVNL